MAPSQAREAGEIGIGRRELATMLHRERGVICVGDELPTRVGDPAEARENHPVLGTGAQPHAIRPGVKLLDERECGRERSRVVENAWIRNDPHKPARRDLRASEGFVRFYEPDEPIRIGIVVRRFLAVRVDEYVDVSDSHVGG